MKSPRWLPLPLQPLLLAPRLSLPPLQRLQQLLRMMPPKPRLLQLPPRYITWWLLSMFFVLRRIVCIVHVCAA